MTIYIDKDALLHKMQERHEDLERNYCKYDNYVMGFGEAIKLIEKAPAADVREVKYAKNLQSRFKWTFECSHCHWCDDDTYCCDSSEFKFCPNCGAKIDLEDDK